MVIQVVLDTNFLVYCAENKVDYASGIDEIMTEGFELVVPSQVISELENLSVKAEKYSTKIAARLALKIIGSNKVKVLKIEAGYADEAILKMAKQNNVIAATIDSELRKKIGRTVRGVTIEGRRKIAFD